MTEKVYSDEKIKARIYRLVTKQEIKLCDIVSTGAMLQQLMEQRDEARKSCVGLYETSKEFSDQRDVVLKDLKALETDIRASPVKTYNLFDLTRSEKYDTGKTD